MSSDRLSFRGKVTISLGSFFLLIGMIALCMWVFPKYGVWQQKLSGEAALKKAEQTRQILVEQAKAEKEAASVRAEAIKIVGAMAKEYPEYRLQEFMGAFAEALQEGNIEQIVYVPTEANLPILEARTK